MGKCKLPDGLVIKPDGENELDPCVYEVIEQHEGVTVEVLKCRKCGHIEVTWRRQGDENWSCAPEGGDD